MTISRPLFCRAGFTLMELSIVLVVIGLIVGGILAGQSLIRASELNALIKQQREYYTAIRAFRDKYNALPGDMTNATDFWGKAAGTGSDSTCRNFVSTGTETCNGNGDFLVMNQSGTRWESYRFWQHLANAGLIAGTYNGTSGSTTYVNSSTSNSPSGKLGRGLWYVDSDLYGSGCSMCGSYAPPGPYFATISSINYMLYGTSNGGKPDRAVLKNEEAWNIDTKIDDGKPATGKVSIMCMVSNVTSCTTASSNTDTTASYLLTPAANTTPLAAILFTEGF